MEIVPISQLILFIMIFKVKHLQCSEVQYLSSSDFCMYLVGLCNAGRNPMLHISSVFSHDGKILFECSDHYCDYFVTIEFRD